MAQTMLKRLIPAAAIIALLSGTASAQMGLPLNKGMQKRPPTQQEIEQQKALDRAYKSATEKIPDKKAPADPWGGVRPAPATASKNSATASKSKQQ